MFKNSLYIIVVIFLVIYLSNAILFLAIGAFIGAVCSYLVLKEQKSEKLKPVADREKDKFQQQRLTEFESQYRPTRKTSQITATLARESKVDFLLPGLNDLLNNIKKDFVDSWYIKLSGNEEFSQATDTVLNNFALKLNSSLATSCLCYELVRRLLANLWLHVATYKKAKSMIEGKSLFTVYSSFITHLHPAAAAKFKLPVEPNRSFDTSKNEANEHLKKMYVQILTENVFNLYFNEEELCCQTLRIPLQEIIAFEVVAPFFSYLTKNFAQSSVAVGSSKKHNLNNQFFYVVDKNESFDIQCTESETSQIGNCIEPNQPKELNSKESNEDLKKAETTLFQNVKIPLTEKTHEVRSNKEYTLYVIEYNVCIKNVQTKYTVRRRFREFVNLQSRLATQANLKKFLKDIDVKEPNRFRTLPFGNMDKEFIQSRRSLLETYLRSLCSIDEICVSSELREFLAYKGDAHIEYVRKAPDLLPRLDKILVRNFAEILGSVSGPLMVDKEDLNIVEEFLDDEMNDEHLTRTYAFYPPSQLCPSLKIKKYLEEKFSTKVSSNIQKNICLHSKKEFYEYPTCSESIQMIICGLILESRYPFLCIQQLQQIFSILSKDTIESLVKKKLALIKTEPDLIFELICESLWPDNILYSDHPDPAKREIKQTPQEFIFRVLERYAFFVKEEQFLGIVKGIFDTLDNNKINRNILFTALDTLLDLLEKNTECQDL